MKIGNQNYSQIVITSTNGSGQLVTADDQKEVIAIISDDDEIIVKNGYEVKMIPSLEKEAAAATTAEKCVSCNDSFGTLELDDGRYICEDCAQHMNDMGT